jgi:gliding motility-associated protein GldL
MGISDFLGSEKGKKLVGLFYGLGASVVIIGALFKIQHYPGAGVMLMVGMFIEAFLFALSAFEKPHKEFDWSLVYPILGQPHGSAAATQAPAKQGGNVVNSLANMGSLKEEDVEKLSNSIKTLGSTASKIADISLSSEISAAYVKNIKDASEAAGTFAANQQAMNAASKGINDEFSKIQSSLSEVIAASENYKSEATKLVEKVSELNAVYGNMLNAMKH